MIFPEMTSFDSAPALAADTRKKMQDLRTMHYYKFGTSLSPIEKQFMLMLKSKKCLFLVVKNTF